MGVPPKNNRELKNEGGWKMIFLFNLVIFRCEMLVFRGVYQELCSGGSFPLQFRAVFFSAVFASEDLEQKEGEI